MTMEHSETVIAMDCNHNYVNLECDETLDFNEPTLQNDCSDGVFLESSINFKQACTLEDPDFDLELEEYIQVLIANQTKHHPVNFLDCQPEVTRQMRADTIFNEFRRAVSMFNLSRNTLHLAVNLMDRFLLLTKISSDCLELLALACLHIAAKKEEVSPPNISELINMVNGRHLYSNIKLINMELLVLQKAEYRLEVPTAALIVACLEPSCLQYHKIYLPEYSLKLVRSLYEDLVDMSLLYYDFMQFSPAVRAYACLEKALSLILYNNEFKYLKWAQKVIGCSTGELVKSLLTLQSYLPVPDHMHDSAMITLPSH